MTPRQKLLEAADVIGAQNRFSGRGLVARLGYGACRILALHAQIKFRRRDSWRRLSNRVAAWCEKFEPWKLAEHLLEAALLPEGVQGTATVYCSSVSGDNSDGSTWAKAKTTVTGALAAATDATFNFVYVDSAHSNTPSAAITWDAATASSFVAIISVNRNGSTTTGHSGWLAGATETVGIDNAAFSIVNTNKAQKMFLFGMTMVGRNDNNTNSDFNIATATLGHTVVIFRSCTITLPAIGINSQIVLGTASQSGVDAVPITFRDCTINLPNRSSGEGIRLNNVVVEWRNTSIGFAGANKPTSLFLWNSNSYTKIDILDSDLSGYNTSGGAYFAVGGFAGLVTVTNCKISATPSITSGTWDANNAAAIVMNNVDSGDTAATFYYYTRLGTLTSNTSNYATNARKFGNSSGVQQSWKIVTTSACSEQEPFVTPWLFGWSADTSAITPSLEFVHDSATALTDRDIWSELEYVSSASFPQGTLNSNRNSQPFDGSTSNHGSGADTWTLSPSMTNENKQKLAHSFTPAEKSVLRARVFVGMASKTLYLDPQIRGLTA